jgi:hypothetical protein
MTSQRTKGPLSDQVHALERETYELRALAGEMAETFQVEANRKKLEKAGLRSLLELADGWFDRLGRIKGGE